MKASVGTSEPLRADRLHAAPSATGADGARQTPEVMVPADGGLVFTHESLDEPGY